VFRASQIFSWVYKKGAVYFDEMTNIPLELKERLKKEFVLFDLSVIRICESKDLTKKLLISLGDDELIEAVIIPAAKRITGCLSTQVGCSFACRFCASGMSGFKKNLSYTQILDELSLVKNNALDKKISHVVFMGMGEPLDNYDQVLQAIRIINAEYAFNIAARRITISTCGIIPGILRLADEGLQVELSISLHAADDTIRSELLPVNKKYPLKDLLAACRQYISKTNRQITFEYVLIKDINSDVREARKLSTIVKGLNCKINLIPCNEIRELQIAPPSPQAAQEFKKHLIASGVHVTLRKARGQDIDSACGQLRLRYEKQ